MAEGSAPPHSRRRALPLIGAPTCTECGACCFNRHPDYIRVFAVDLERMDERAFALTEERDGHRFLRFAEGRCAALSLDHANSHVGCSIYEMRPDVCRWLERGSGECRSQLESKWAVREAAFGRG